MSISEFKLPVYDVLLSPIFGSNSKAGVCNDFKSNQLVNNTGLIQAEIVRVKVITDKRNIFFLI